MRNVLIAIFPLISSLASAAGQIAGRASVIDGDTIEVHGQRIRFHGIDAPESGQFCIAQDKQYRCGQQAALALADRIAADRSHAKRKTGIVISASSPFAV